MRISVFGIGYVGAVSCACLAELGHEVIGIDVNPEKVEMLRGGISPIVEAEIGDLTARAVAQNRLTATGDTAAAIAATDVSFIAVGTPSAPDGSPSMTAVDAVTAAIGQALAAKTAPHVVIMRSTVPPGTAEERVIPALEKTSGSRAGDGFLYYSNPEFLREGTAVHDFGAPPFTLLGAAAGDDAPLLRELYAPLAAPLHVIPYRVAESVKYLSNVYHAVKLAFANEAGAVLAAHGVDARAAFRLFCEDRALNISPAYLRPGFAFGGSCLPKDLRSLVYAAQRADVSVPILSHVLSSNADHLQRAVDLVERTGKRRVGLFGLSFKPGTDDLRESPLVELAERLFGKGYDLRIYDANVSMSRLLGANREYIENRLPHLAQLLADSVDEVLDHAEVCLVGTKDEAVLAALPHGEGPDIIDLVRLPDADARRTEPGYTGLVW